MNSEAFLGRDPSGILAAAIAKLKDKVLFPEKVEKAKPYTSESF
jgi:hypothetical protein